MTDLGQGWLGSEEVLRGEVGQAPTGNCLRCDDNPYLVDALLPGQRHIAVDPPQQFGKPLEFDLFAGATNEDAPSRATVFVDVVDLKGNSVFPQPAYLGPALRTEDDSMTSD